MLGTISLLANTVLPGLVYASTEEHPGTDWEFVDFEEYHWTWKAGVWTYTQSIVGNKITYSNLSLNLWNCEDDWTHAPLWRCGLVGVLYFAPAEGAGNGNSLYFGWHTWNDHDSIKNASKTAADPRYSVWDWYPVTVDKVKDAIADGTKKLVYSYTITWFDWENVVQKDYDIEINVENVQLLSGGETYFQVEDGKVSVLCDATLIPDNSEAVVELTGIVYGWWSWSDPASCDFTCNENYTWSWDTSKCEPDTRATESCGWSVPANATEKTGHGKYAQTWDWEKWNPETVSWTFDADECGFTCNVNYTWSWDTSKCEPDEFQITYTLPDWASLAEWKTNPVTYTIETEAFTLNNPSLEWSKFKWWKEWSSEELKSTVTIEKWTTGPKSFEAVFEEITVPTGSTDEKLIPDAWTSVSTWTINASMDNAVAVEQFNADDYSWASAPATPTVIIQQKEANAAYSEEWVSESQLESEFNSFVETTGMIADVNGIIDVQLYYVSGSTSTPLWKVNFSEPVRVYIPVNWASKVRIRVKHTWESTYGTGWLTTDATATCLNGEVVEAAKQYTGWEIPVTNGMALIYTCSASSFVAYSEVKPTPAPSYSGGWGGGGSSKKTETNTWSVTTWAVENATWSTETLWEENKDETVNENNEGNTAMTDDAAVAKFGQEQIDAYKWALENGITTMKTVEEARLDQPLTRAELAKMMVVYVAKVLGKQPVITGDVSYQDVDANKLGDLAGYIKLAYQYQIMWIDANGDPIEFFNPNGLVTRWEYATVFSRVLFWSKFNKEWADFYTNHLEALEAAGILSNTEPTIKEMRGWVMLMMYRSSKNIEAIEKVAAEVEATDEEVAEAEAKAEEETTTEENAEATTWDVAEAPEAEVTTWDVVEAPAEASTWDTASN